MIPSDILRGHTDTIILARLAEGDSYGYIINKTVREKTQGAFEFKEATLYQAFRRLEQAGLITSYWGGEATGARRRYYSLTDAGRAMYAQNVHDWQRAKDMIDRLIGMEGEQ
jgi:PadR family transcriptional regulator PadR